MRILIAGATGAIGRALVRRLRANQHEVFVLTQSREPVIADALDAAV
jgi:nucleoside-diphosphate-sugar epimerase